MSTQTDPMYHQVVDVRGQRCVMLSMTINGLMDKVAPGQIVEVLSDDPAANTEVPTWCRSTGNELILMEKQESHLRILIRRNM